MIGNEGDAIIIAEDAERERLHVAVEDVVDDDLILVVLLWILPTMLSHRLNTTKTVEGVFVIGNGRILPRFVQVSSTMGCSPKPWRTTSDWMLSAI